MREAPTSRAPALAPNVPAHYYDRIAAAEQAHWWHAGMREHTRVLLAERLALPGQALLDAGCGTGGFLRWIGSCAAFGRLAGVDISQRAIDMAAERSPGLELRRASLHRLPFA